MRFGFLAGGVALGSFLAGYSSWRDAPRVREIPAMPAEISPKPAQHEVPPIDSGRPPHVASAPDLLAALQPSVDPITRGERILAAIESLDAPALAALLTPPRATELQRLLKDLVL